MTETELQTIIEKYGRGALNDILNANGKQSRPKQEIHIGLFNLRPIMWLKGDKEMKIPTTNIACPWNDYR